MHIFDFQAASTAGTIGKIDPRARRINGCHQSIISAVDKIKYFLNSSQATGVEIKLGGIPQGDQKIRIDTGNNRTLQSLTRPNPIYAQVFCGFGTIQRVNPQL